MTDQIPMRSASERRDAARKALRDLRSGVDGPFGADSGLDSYTLAAVSTLVDRVEGAIAPLLEVPEVGITEQDLVNEAMRWFNECFGYTIAKIDGFGTAQQITAMLMHLAREAKRAALEHWEPADVPSQEFMLRHLGLDYEDATDDEGDPDTIRIRTQFIAKED